MRHRENKVRQRTHTTNRTAPVSRLNQATAPLQVPDPVKVKKGIHQGGAMPRREKTLPAKSPSGGIRPGNSLTVDGFTGADHLAPMHQMETL